MSKFLIDMYRVDTSAIITDLNQQDRNSFYIHILRFLHNNRGSLPPFTQSTIVRNKFYRIDLAYRTSRVIPTLTIFTKSEILWRTLF